MGNVGHLAKAAILAAIVSVALVACGGSSRERDETYRPSITSVDFASSTTVTNPYLPFPAGTTYVYEGQTKEGVERIEIHRLAETRQVMGITCIIVNDKAWVDGKLIEDTDDWFAQANDGTVWYFGEAVDNYGSNGKVEDHDGSWEAGVDGALPGIVMPARPSAGLAYRQEYYFKHAEDQAEIVETGLTLRTPLGTFTDVIKVRETTALESDVLEFKFYAPGIGLIKVINEAENEEINLIEIRK